MFSHLDPAFQVDRNLYENFTKNRNLYKDPRKERKRVFETVKCALVSFCGIGWLCSLAKGGTMKTMGWKLPRPVHPNEGRTSGAAYDTAWTARVTDENGNPLFPECVQWLLENQKPDGSWGGQTVNYHDRLLSTVAALIALKEVDRRPYSAYIKKGETYIWETLKKLELDRCRLIGSELLLPSLMNQAESVGLHLPYPIKVYKREYQLKLEKADESVWYSPLATLSFSLEFLGDNVNTEHLARAQLKNGSVAASPAATAFFLKHTRDVKAFEYLRTVLSITGDGSVMTVYPVDVFEYGWTVYNLMLAGLYLKQYTEICDFLFNQLKPTGVGPSSKSPLTDADDTAVVSNVLYRMQYPVDSWVLNTYDAGAHYLTFDFELDPSLSTNIHVLDFVRSCPEFPEKEEVSEQLVQFLRKHMHSRGFWLDKWHISPYYPTSHAVFPLCSIDPSLAEKAVSWIGETQNENGTWGVNGGTREETAYAVQALMYYHQNVESIDISQVSKALPHVGSLLFSSSTVPEQWIGKVLYTPMNVVFSSMVSASVMYNATVWNLCSGWSV